MTRSDMREHTFKILFRVPFHNKNELREQIDYYFDALPDVKEKEYEYIKKKALLVSEMKYRKDGRLTDLVRLNLLLCDLQYMRCYMMTIFRLMLLLMRRLN